MTEAVNNSWDPPGATEDFVGALEGNFRHHRSGRLMVVCTRCGSLVSVTYTQVHDEWHDSLVFEVFGETVLEGELIREDEPEQPAIEEKP